MQNRSNSGLTEFLRVAKPFNGRVVDPIAAEDWIEHMEKVFDAQEVNEDQKVKFASYMLEGLANDWWRTTKLHLTPPISWLVFRDTFFTKYFPGSFREEMQRRYFELKQDNMYVAEYEMELHRLMRYVSIAVQTNEKTRIQRFLYGLNSRLQQDVRVLELTTYLAVVNKAKLMEQENNRFMMERQSSLRKRTRDEADGSGTKKPTWYNSFTSSGTFSFCHLSEGGEKHTEFPEFSVQQSGGGKCNKCGGLHKTEECRWKTRACLNCGEFGHNALNCHKSKSCYCCKQEGHIARNCPLANTSYGTVQEPKPPIFEYGPSRVSFSSAS